MPECERVRVVRGLCRMHYSRLRRQGSVDLPRRAKRNEGVCVIDGCSDRAFCKGWCRRHYTRWYETGSTSLGVRNPPKPPPPAPVRPLAERFSEKVLKGPNHWLWIGAKTKQGYGTIWDNERKGHAMAHRVSWELASGNKIPEGMVIDHLCRTPSCVNPAHLEVVSVSANTARGLAGEVGGRRNRIKTHCPQGHPYSPENTYYYNNGRTRVCRTCAIERTQARRRANQA